ncbi:MAG: hypothetical protein RIR69_1485 [Actinomycetota bacterium]|jgi:hypothetical protein
MLILLGCIRCFFYRNSLILGWYDDKVLPRAIDKLTGSTGFDDFRRHVAAPLHGEVLEVISGSGTNVKFFPDEVTQVYAVAPATFAHRRRKK